MRLRKGYEAFHGHPPRVEGSIRFNPPKTGLVRLGKATAIEYECDKLNGGGDGTMAVYRHEFETPVALFMDASGKRQLYLIGNRLKVTEAGIEN